MVNLSEVSETIRMITQENLDVRTITMGISLLDCADSDPKAMCRKVYDRIAGKAEKLVETGAQIEKSTGSQSSTSGFP